MSVKILVDSACDMLPNEAIQKNITLLPLTCCFGEEEYQDGVNMSHQDFFIKLIETDVFPTTSALSPYDYQKAYDNAVEDGSSAVMITLSSRLSSCYQNAYLSAQDYDNVFVVDSLNASLGERILVEYAVLLRDEYAAAGLSDQEAAQKIAEALEDKKSKVRLIALLDTLEYLKKGGRISAVTAIAGNLLSIKPVISLRNGEVVTLGQARGSKKGNNILNEFVQNEGIDFEMPFTLAFSGLHDDLLQKYLQDSAHIYESEISKDNIPVMDLGCAIGSHIGPGAIGTAFFCK